MTNYHFRNGMTAEEFDRLTAWTPHPTITRKDYNMDETDNTATGQLHWLHGYDTFTGAPIQTSGYIAPAPTSDAAKPNDLNVNPMHVLKSWPWFFQPMIDGIKKHDMRKKSDRDYKVGDVVQLREFDPRGSGYTGREAYFRITYITSDDTPCALSSNALDQDAVILSLEKIAFASGPAVTTIRYIPGEVPIDWAKVNDLLSPAIHGNTAGLQ